MLSIIKSTKEEGISRSNLTRRTQYLKPFERSQILEDLEDAELICSRAIPGTGAKECTMYYYCGE